MKLIQRFKNLKIQEFRQWVNELKGGKGIYERKSDLHRHNFEFKNIEMC